MAILNYFYEKNHSDMIFDTFQEKKFKNMFPKKYICQNIFIFFVKWSFLYNNLLFYLHNSLPIMRITALHLTALGQTLWGSIGIPSRADLI